MTSKFRKALDGYNNHMEILCVLMAQAGLELKDDDGYIADTIRQALLIAERLESGVVTDGMTRNGINAECPDGYHDLHCNEIFKAMAKVMIEDVCGV